MADQPSEQSPFERAFRQSIPRPPQARRLELPGASFVGLGGDGEGAVLSEEAVAAAMGRLGDESGAPDDSAVRAAVLLALGWPDDGKLRLLVIRRSPHLRDNPGELAFPGGRLEPGETVVAAALREAEEEVGLQPRAVTVLGRLPGVWALSRRGEIAPVVGLVAGSPELRASAEEVDEVFLLELDQLFDPALYWEEEWAREAEEAWLMHFFDRDTDVIWGVSARILVTFLEALAAEWNYARSPETSASPGEPGG